MGLVRTPEELDRLRAAMRDVRFMHAEVLSAELRTTDAFARAVLPPGFTPAEEPLLLVRVGRWRSTVCGDFAGGAVAVACAHDGVLGTYVLAMYMTTERAVVFGRETFGEPKKLASSALHRAGDRMHGTIARGGTVLVDVVASLGEDLGPQRAAAVTYNVKARPASDGTGLEEDALIVLGEGEGDLRVVRPGTAKVRFGGTVHDPLDELEVVEVLGARYVEGDFTSHHRVVGSIPRDAALPYVAGRWDDWGALDSTTTL
jgi:acetoacetate decarboxylase